MYLLDVDGYIVVGGVSKINDDYRIGGNELQPGLPG